MIDEGLIATGLKRFRKDFKLKQKDVASILGITNQAYQNYEYGKGYPSAVAIFKLAKEFNVTSDYLLGMSDEPRPWEEKAKPSEIEQFDEKTLNLLRSLQAWKDAPSAGQVAKQ
ncbi:MAG: helix-turn-helix transcriptional regulator [Selenomonadaceae bacterium]|nr:helix-turn-helix transcriptional regulator [Selenomonadaceae bacterium]